MTIRNEKWWIELCKKADLVTKQQLGYPLDDKPIPTYSNWPNKEENGIVTHRNNKTLDRNPCEHCDCGKWLVPFDPNDSIDALDDIWWSVSEPMQQDVPPPEVIKLSDEEEEFSAVLRAFVETTRNAMKK